MAKQQTDPTPDLTALTDENAALKAQQDQMLDMLVELREKLQTLETTGVPVVTPAVTDEEAQLNAELAALKEEFKDFEGLEVFERRVLVGADANNEIRLLDEPSILQDPRGTLRTWKLRWFNFAKEGRASQAEREGYVKVKWAELQSAESIASAVAGERKDEYVRQGDRGLEVLCKMPLKLYDYKKKRDAARMGGVLTSEARLRDHLAGNVASLAGKNGMNADQAGSLIHSKSFSMSITPGETETITL